MEIEGERRGIPTLLKKYISIVAFADDLVLLSGSWAGMQKNIDILKVFCNLTGLKIQGEKCHSIYIQPAEDSYMINDCPFWSISGAPLNVNLVTWKNI